MMLRDLYLFLNLLSQEGKKMRVLRHNRNTVRISPPIANLGEYTTSTGGLERMPDGDS